MITQPPGYPKPFDPATATVGARYWNRSNTNQYRFIALTKHNTIFENIRGDACVRSRNGRFFQQLEDDNDIVIHCEDVVAEGRNPQKLTNGQVGEGYRLTMECETYRNDAEFFLNGKWETTSNTCGQYSAPYSYRVPIAPQKRPLGQTDFPPGTVVRSGANHYFMVTYCALEGIGIQHRNCATYEALMLESWEYSVDRGATWRPCWK